MSDDGGAAAAENGVVVDISFRLPVVVEVLVFTRRGRVGVCIG